MDDPLAIRAQFENDLFRIFIVEEDGRRTMVILDRQYDDWEEGLIATLCVAHTIAFFEVAIPALRKLRDLEFAEND